MVSIHADNSGRGDARAARGSYRNYRKLPYSHPFALESSTSTEYLVVRGQPGGIHFWVPSLTDAPTERHSASVGLFHGLVMRDLT